jgi:hypothetical protein
MDVPSAACVGPGWACATRRRRLTLAAAVVVIGCAPSTAATDTQAAAARCGPGEARVALGLPVSPMTGEHADLFVITNLSNRSCSLEGYPSVSLGNGEQRARRRAAVAAQTHTFGSADFSAPGRLAR